MQISTITGQFHRLLQTCNNQNRMLEYKQ